MIPVAHFSSLRILLGRVLSLLQLRSDEPQVSDKQSAQPALAYGLPVSRFSFFTVFCKSNMINVLTKHYRLRLVLQVSGSSLLSGVSSARFRTHWQQLAPIQPEIRLMASALLELPFLC
jgi:hypothetical protein